MDAKKEYKRGAKTGVVMTLGGVALLMALGVLSFTKK